MNTSVLWILAAGAVLMAATAWLVYPSSPSLDPGTAYRFMHCPKCKVEAGLEPVKRAPLPMLLFAAFLATAVLATAVSGVLSLASSSR